ncbi:MAG: SMC family ATPase, partial [Anaerolineales bacterium]|nr:SMC family ATPase [Anaerolineales bacterium]
MIPLRLELRNFLAYKNPAPLDFSGLHVAVLTGENGAGKSSLLDAITWVLWGRARARKDEELVHQGQSEMHVELTFALGSDVYRVTRKKRIGKGASTVLDLQAQVNGKWNSLTEATIPKTQEKITRLLRLNYETFVNSAYLVQGKADEFTGKRPAERKQVLADILGLQEWEVYEERAKAKIKALDQQMSGLDAVLAEIEAELARRPEYERELSAAQARVIEVNERLRAAEAEWAQIENARQALLGLQRQSEELTRRLRDAESELVALDADLAEAQARADTAALTRKLDEVERRLRQLDEIETERERLTEARRLNAELMGQLRGQNEAAQQEAEGLKKRIAAASVEAKQAVQRVQQAAQAEVARLNTRIANLQSATEAVCPTCGQPLSEAQRHALIADLRAEAEARQAQARAEEQDINNRLVLLVNELDREIEARRGLYRENQARLKALADQQAQLDRDLQAFALELKEKPALTQQLGELKSALTQAGAAQQRIAELMQRRERWAKARGDAEQALAQLEAEAERQRAVLREADAKQRALDSLRQEDTFAKARLGAAEQKLRALEAQAQAREAKRAERRQLAESRGVYEELREAFGKKGVPAMMIEAAVPEIEAAANRLLGRITDGRMHVRFRMQRETQAGETRETLDIEIADELGTRAYEMYSGGEAFRVNFAIRIALSQLLARRAGTQLHTLIIDEGFGVLDAVGRERLVEAIHAVQDDFERILVVTHIDELKDAFPARIEVTKTP